ncbi:MAG: hypothetical protein ABS960_14535, partial [Solibacillus isronensis]
MEILATFARDFFIGVEGSVSDRGRVLLSGWEFLLFSSNVLLLGREFLPFHLKFYFPRDSF